MYRKMNGMSEIEKLFVNSQENDFLENWIGFFDFGGKGKSFEAFKDIYLALSGSCTFTGMCF